MACLLCVGTSMPSRLVTHNDALDPSSIEYHSLFVYMSAVRCWDGLTPCNLSLTAVCVLWVCATQLKRVESELTQVKARAVHLEHTLRNR